MGAVTVGGGAPVSVQSMTVSKTHDVEKTLQEIASITHGKYFRARNQKELNSIYATIDKLEAIEHEAEIFRPKQSLFHWPLGAMLVLCLMLIACKRFTSVRGSA